MNPNLEGMAPGAAPSSPSSEALPEDRNGEDPLLEIPPEVIPNLDNIIIDDGKPVDSIYVEKQQRLLTEPLYSSWTGPGEGRPFLALSNVGLFYGMSLPPLVSDMMLSLDIKLGDMAYKENRSYFVWIRGKVPDIVVEIVSDRRGGETTHKMRDYAKIGIPYYVVFDPVDRLASGVLRSWVLYGRTYQILEAGWFPAVGLGLTLWQGKYEGEEARWLRWCDQAGRLIVSGQELVEQERQRAEQERLHAEQERQRAEQERMRNERLEAQLRALGIEPAS